MGSYLDKPATSKASLDGSVPSEAFTALPFAVSEMQGWRKNMEDAVISLPSLPRAGAGAGAGAGGTPGGMLGGTLSGTLGGTLGGTPGGRLSLFAVLDGHGGRDVSAFVKDRLPGELSRSEELSQGRVREALEAAFHRMDDLLRDEGNGAELARLRGDSSGSLSSGEGRRGAQASIRRGGTPGSGPGANAGASAQSPKSLKDSMRLDVKNKMQAAEQKGELSKQEALELVMKMLKLRKLEESEAEEQQRAGTGAGAATGVGSDAGSDAGTGADAGEGADSAAAATAGVAVGARYTEAGCTAVVALLQQSAAGNVLWVANAGDSRAVLSRGGRAVALSEDHKPNVKSELERIRAAGGYVNDVGRVNGNLNLSRSLGDLKYKTNARLAPHQQVISGHPDVVRSELTPQDDFFLLACDGVFDVMANQRLVDFVRARLRALARGLREHRQHQQPYQTPRLSSVIEELFAECLCDDPSTAQGMGADNMSAVLVLLRPLASFADERERGDQDQDQEQDEDGASARASARVSARARATT
jgi:protein phosphatase 1G